MTFASGASFFFALTVEERGYLHFAVPWMEKTLHKIRRCAPLSSLSFAFGFLTCLARIWEGDRRHSEGVFIGLFPLKDR